MQLNSKLLLKRISLIAFESALIAGLVLLMAGGGLTWRLHNRPLEIEFARSAIENALRDTERGLYVSTKKVVLHWPDIRGPLLLGIQGALLYGPQGQTILSIDEAALGLNKRALLLGQIKPESIIVKAPSLQIRRLDARTLDIDVGTPESPGIMGPKQSDTPLVEIILSALSGKEGQDVSSPLSALKRFEIERARLVIDDRVLGMSWSLPRTDIALLRASSGLQADIAVELPSHTNQTPTLESTILLDNETGALDINAVLQRFSPSFLAEKFPELEIFGHQSALIHAQIKARLDKDMTLQTADMTVISDAGALNIESLSPDPVPFGDFGLLVKYDRAEGRLSIPKAQITLGGVAAQTGGDFQISEKMDRINGPVRLSIARLPHAAIAPLWPTALKGDSSEEWIVEKITGGIFTDLFAQGNLDLAKTNGEWAADMQNVIAGFAFEDMTVDYRPPLRPVTGAKGKGQFDLDTQKLAVTVEKADAGDLHISSADLEFIDIIKKGAGTADIHVKLNGPLESALDYVASDPINVTPDFATNKPKGTVDVAINLQFPTTKHIPKEAVKIDMRGKLLDFNLPGIVKTLSLSGKTLDIAVDKGAFRVKGKSAIDNRPATLTYEEYLNSKNKPWSSRAQATLSADRALREKLGIDLSTFMDGPANVDVTYTTYQDKRSEAGIKADLTPSTLDVKPFDYTKKPGAPASATLKAILKNGELKEVRDLTATAPNLKLENTNLHFRNGHELSGGKTTRFVLGETVANAEFEIDAKGLVKLAMNGPFLDLRPFLNNEDEEKKEYDGPPMNISVSVDRMRTADKETVQYGKLYVDIDSAGQFRQLEMDAVAGQGDIYLRYKPDGSGKRTFRFEADDAGATLKAFDLYKNMKGGKMVVYGEPIRSVFDRNLLGRAQITDFKVVNAPALAQLLGIMSLPGLMQSLNGEGLSFAKMECDFDWLYRPHGSLLVLKEGRTSGNSLGLTFDGTFDNAAQTLDVSGTVIPLSGINKAIGSIPLLGDILTGGTGALIAATYTMKGKAGKPDISVNPLSVLTPGILRRILFEEQ